MYTARLPKFLLIMQQKQGFELYVMACGASAPCNSCYDMIVTNQKQLNIFLL